MSILHLGKQDFYTGYGEEVHTRCVDYSGTVYRINRCGEYQVWYKQSGSCWGGVGSERIYSEPWLVLVKVTDNPDSGIAVEVEGYELNRSNSREVRTALIQKCNRLGGTQPVSTPLPKKEKPAKPALPTQEELEDRRFQAIIDTLGTSQTLKDRLIAWIILSGSVSPTQPTTSH